MIHSDKYFIEEDKDGITIIRDSDVIQNDSFISRSELASLDEQLLQREIISPRVIYDLLNKEWISKRMLYEIATLIKLNNPEVKYNWYVTFNSVEVEFLRREEGRRSEPDQNESSLMRAADNVLYEILEQPRVWSQAGKYELLKNRIKENLKLYNL